ncbi:MAG TPA: class I SAM-dependent methyltransferase [Tepidisphaeraceae bacterium]|nr:class I SAM-dependent methyltransferase [Tepidisphaeraceae bacterium]
MQAWPLDLSRVLDLAAGSGEATLALRSLGAKHVEAADPYTAEAYADRTGAVAERISFEDVAAGALSGRRYTLIVCSFALHLCAPSRLPVVAQQLALVADALLVLTPHKRPVLREQWGWLLEGELVVERVRARWYRGVVEIR